jgi:hypothetical protein
MFHTSVNSKTTMTFSLLIFALASLFATDLILGNQQALAANAGGSFDGGGSLVGAGSLGGHLYF